MSSHGSIGRDGRGHLIDGPKWTGTCYTVTCACGFIMSDPLDFPYLREQGQLHLAGVFASRVVAGTIMAANLTPWPFSMVVRARDDGVLDYEGGTDPETLSAAARAFLAGVCDLARAHGVRPPV